MSKRKTAAEIIAFHVCCDFAEMSENRYQPSKYYNPAIYVIGDDYFAAPSNNKPPRAIVGKPWQEVGEHYGRKVFISEMESA